MAYIPSECSIKEYEEVIYGGDTRNKCYLSFENQELENSDDTLERITIKSNIIDTTKKVFTLNNFIARSLEMTIHDIDKETIKEPLELKIGTYINDTLGYVYVPIGKFVLQDTPTTSNGVTTIKARDYAVKFDVPYNAKPLMDNNEGKATKKQILQNICDFVGVVNGVESFGGENEEVGVYDSTINARTYVGNLAENSGCFAYIDRQGALKFIPINNLYKWVLNYDDVSKATSDIKYTIKNVVWESGEFKFTAPLEEVEGDTLYLDGTNPYINSQEIVNRIYEVVKDFSIDSLKLEKMYSNPCIDSFDLIQVNDFVTLAQNTFTYNGKMMSTYETTISREKRETNVYKNSIETFKKYVRSEIDNVKGELTTTVGRIDGIDIHTGDNNTAVNDLRKEMLQELEKYTLQNDYAEFKTETERKQTDTYTKEEIRNIASGVAEDGTEVSVVRNKIMTIDIDGLTIASTDDQNKNTKTNMNTDGFRILDTTVGTSTLFEAVYDKELGQTRVKSANITVQNYFVMGKHSRFEDYQDGTGCFYIN